MSSKARRYLTYTLKFLKSRHKKEILAEVIAEIRKKGFVSGIQSMLHRRVMAKGSNYKPPAYPAFIKQSLVKNYTERGKIMLPDTATPRVSVIIPMYNQVDYTLDCIYSVFVNSSGSDYEIIVADDNSPDNTSGITRYFEHVRVTRNEVNLGFLKNCNNAAKQARGEYLVFLNNDTQVQKGWMEELLNVFHHFDKAGLVGSKLVYPDGRLQEAGGIIWQDGSGWNYGNQDDPTKPEYNYVKEADYISGASVMIPRKLWDELGGFDEAFSPAYCEDSDLCFRVRQHGYKVFYQPFSVAVHFEGVTHGTNVNQGVKHYQVVNQKKLVERWKDELAKKSPNAVNVFSERDRTTGKKHVLIVDHYLPEVDKDAGSRTISNFIDCLLELGYSVKFLGENQNSSPHYLKQYQEKGIEVLYGADFNFFDQSWKKYLKDHMHLFDAFLLSRSSVCMPVLSFLRGNIYKGKIIYYGHDLGFLRLEKEAALKNDDNIRILARKIKADEDYMYQNVDYALVISQEETDYLSKYVATPLKYIPPYFFEVKDDTPAFDKREGLFFIGGFNHPPNREAMKWFLDEVYAPLHEQGISFTIAGSLMPDFIYDYRKKYSRLVVKRDVPSGELEQLYAGTRVVVVPLLSGAGVKGKVIEAMAKGVPVVGTGIAFEGMPKGDDFAYAGVDSPSDMVAAILRVYNSREDWDKYAAFGKGYIQKYYNREGMKKVFADIIG